MKLIIFLALLCFASIVDAADWQRRDSELQARYLALHFTDMMQTQQIADSNDKFHEQNVLLGRNPSQDIVSLYFVTTAAGHTLISYCLPHPYRVYWQWVTIGVETWVVTSNYSLGIRIPF